jgi:hypothetical protein
VLGIRPTTGSQCAGWPCTTSCHHRSRPGCIGTSCAVCRSTITFSMLAAPVGQRLVGGGLELHHLAAPMAAIGGDDEARAGILDPVAQAQFAEKPPNTTEWMAPMRAQACIAMMASGTIGM